MDPTVSRVQAAQDRIVVEVMAGGTYRAASAKKTAIERGVDAKCDAMYASLKNRKFMNPVTHFEQAYNVVLEDYAALEVKTFGLMPLRRWVV